MIDESWQCSAPARVCGRRARLPAYLVPVAMGFAPGGAAAVEDVERDLRCSLQAHATGEHHAHVMHLAGRDTGAVWARWSRPEGEVRLVVLPDCPAVGPPPAGEGCCEYGGHPGGHSYELTGRRMEET
ncbi:hypothetical protein [Streptomyces sp. HPF1205]|uniref:hypothetical protein n=1 Tax=Streptomyces sp. HPF1205 TaxID=2873262 RepID=UPI001CED361F|nr:hypothetical protein [Streptomyces sp. HPF1205]